LAAAVCALFCGAALGADPPSCAQLDYAQELPPMAPDPRLELDADHVDASQSGISRLSGSVRVSRNGRQFSADTVNYDDRDRRVRIDTQSLYRDERIVIKSQRADFDLNADTGVFEDSEFTILPLAARGTAERIEVARAGTAQMSKLSYTSCAPGSEAWLLTADRLQLDNNEGVGYAHDALLRFQDVPILWVPYFRFPIDGQRHSGFLPPTIGETNKTGFDFKIPFYLNLASNYDATLIPRVMSERGAQIDGRLRYLGERSEGSFYGEYLPNDQKVDRSRSFVNFNHEGLINQRLSLETHYAEVSDRQYFEDLGGSIDQTSTPYLPRGASLTYQAPTTYTIQALVQSYQPISSTLTPDGDPYKRLPQIRLDALTKRSYLGTHAGIDGEFTNFVRENSVQGQRFVAQPYLRWEQDRNAWFASSQADLSYTAYRLSNVAPGIPEEPRRTLPILSAEGGLRFERVLADGRLQTLEPHLFYLFVPYRNQDPLPLFDTGLPDFDFPELFARNRYTGEDRISDANQLTSALSTRLIDPASGLVRLTASVGEIYRFSAPRVDLPGAAQPSTGTSDYLATADYQISRRWAAAATAEWTPEFDRISRSAFALRYRDPDAGALGQRVDLAYRYRQGLLEQADLGLSQPISDAWRVATRLQYSLRDSRSLNSFVGAEYQTCCWAIQATYRRYLSNFQGQFSNGFYLQFELKGLGHLGNSFDTLLPAYDPDAPVPVRNRVSVVP
jgi:LPS-assembly protein